MIRTTAIIANLLLAACTPAVVDSGCQSFRPITYSASQDSEATKDQIKEHNNVWRQLCER